MPVTPARTEGSTIRTPPVDQSFDRLAAHYDRYGWLVGDELRSWLRSHLPGGHTAVDLGCGTGLHTEVIAGRYDRVLAVDLSTPMLGRAARRRPLSNVDYHRRDLTELNPARDGRFDLVFSAYTLHHVEDLDATLAGIRRLAAPGGTVVLVDIVGAARPRRVFVGRAAGTLAGDLRRRRRPLGEAVELFRLSVDRGWLAHQAADRPLAPAEFEDRYGAAFPGARFTPLHRARLLHWTAPAPDRAAQPPR